MPDFDALDALTIRRGERQGQPLPPKQAKALAKAAARSRHACANATSLTTTRPNVSTPSSGNRRPVRTHLSYGATGRKRGQGPSSASIMTASLRHARPYPSRGHEGEEPDEEEAAFASRSTSRRRCFSSALADDLTAHRTAAFRAVLADRPEWRLPPSRMRWRLPVFYDRRRQRPCATCRQRPYLRAEGIDDSACGEAIRRAARRLGRAFCPSDEAALWDWLLAQDGRDRHRAAGLLRGMHRQAGTRAPRRPACRRRGARHGAVVAADRGRVSRARAEDAHPLRPSPKARARRRRTTSPRSRKATWPTVLPNCSPAPAGFPPCCGPRSSAAGRYRLRRQRRGR